MNPVVRRVVWVAGFLLACFIALGIAFYMHPLSFFDRLTYIQMRVGGASSREISVDGHRVHYYVQGPADGSPVVLVHGLGGRAEDWRNLVPYLRASGYRVYTPDLPGYGRSEEPRDFSYSVPDEASAVVGFMDALGLKQVDLGGWSMGGWIVQRIASEHPERVKKLLIFDSAGLYERPSWNTALFTPTTALQLDQLDALLMPHPPQPPAFITRDILRSSQEHAWVLHRALDSMLSGKDTTDALLPSLKMPVLIVWGALDHITPLSQGQTMHKLIPQSQLEVIDGCGHLAPVQCADRIGPKVADFLKK